MPSNPRLGQQYTLPFHYDRFFPPLRIPSLQLKEHCVQSLGYLSVGEPQFPLKLSVMEALLKLKEEKAMEFQFSVGEAMACTLAGEMCTLAHDTWKLPSSKQDKRYI